MPVSKRRDGLSKAKRRRLVESQWRAAEVAAAKGLPLPQKFRSVKGPNSTELVFKLLNDLRGVKFYATRKDVLIARAIADRMAEKNVVEAA